MHLSAAFKRFLVGFSVVLLVACGGGGGDDDPEFKVGVFRDTAVSGLSYVAGSRNGITQSDGTFNYEVGEPVTFSIGGVTLGTTNSQGVITPVDLFSGATTSTTAVVNMARFLLMLDVNGDPDGGIQISDAVQTAAASWSQVNFDAADFTSEVASIIADATTADGSTHTLPSSADAQSHLESTLRCTRAGGYRGSFSGDDSGPFGVLVDANTGFLSGFAYSNADQALLTLTGTSAFNLDQSGSFISGDASSGATFSGRFNGPDALSGSWELGSDDGSFSGSRIGGSNAAIQRFTGSFSGDAFGLFTFDVDGASNVTGIAYTVFASSDGTTDELSSFTGTLVGNSLNATIVENGNVEATITGTLGVGSINGNWSDADGNSGTFTGSGCSLI